MPLGLTAAAVLHSAVILARISQTLEERTASTVVCCSTNRFQGKQSVLDALPTPLLLPMHRLRSQTASATTALNLSLMVRARSRATHAVRDFGAKTAILSAVQLGRTNQHPQQYRVYFVHQTRIHLLQEPRILLAANATKGTASCRLEAS